MLVRHLAVVPERLTSAHSENVARDLTRVTAALQTQITGDLAPLWHVDATVSAFTSIEDVPLGHWVIFLKESIGEADEPDFISIRTTSPTRWWRTTRAGRFRSATRSWRSSSIRPATGSWRGRPSIRSIRTIACAICSSCAIRARTARTRTRSTAWWSRISSRRSTTTRRTRRARATAHRCAAVAAGRAARGLPHVEDPVLGAWYQLNVGRSAPSRNSMRSKRAVAPRAREPHDAAARGRVPR